MNKDQALQLALEALERIALPKNADPIFVKAITAIKEALETKDEPKCVAIVEVFEKDWRLDYMSLPVGKHKLYAQQYTYTIPQRTWVELTDEDIQKLAAEQHDWESLYLAVQAKLKEKNT